jgi:hypothetical protein
MRRRLALAATAIVLAGAAYGLHKLRSPGIVLSFHWPAGDKAGPPPLTPAAGEGLPRAERVRVVLIDGLGADHARTLAAHSSMCRVDLDVDVGFPTVSLPVQHVLWTGLTHQQSGIPNRNDLLPVPSDGIPPRSPGSIGVAEFHPEIVGSFGFHTSLPPREGPRASNALWRKGGFPPAAMIAVASEARLAFVHILTVDEAGHAEGPASQRYRDAAAEADRWLAALLAAERAAHPDGRTRWFVLSDHGHRPGGGHGDAEPFVRRVRVCIGGDVPASLDGRTGRMHLVDVSRAISDSLGTGLPAGAAGRPIAAALAAPDLDATLPRPSTLRWILAALLALTGLAATVWALRGDGLRGLLNQPLWWPVAWFALLYGKGAPTLSSSIVWSPKGAVIAETIYPGLIVLAVLSSIALLLGAPIRRVLVGQLALPIALAAAALVLCGVPADLLAGNPPLMPYWSARASAWLILVVTGAAVLSLPLLACAVLGRSDRSTAAGSA